MYLISKVNMLREVSPFPSFPLEGEGEWSVGMKRETINSKHEIRLRSRFRMWARHLPLREDARRLGRRGSVSRPYVDTSRAIVKWLILES